MFANIEKPFGPGAFHPGERPLTKKPSSSSGRGLHYTEDGSSVTLWVWHADGGETHRCESNRVGPPAKPTSAQIRGLAPYKGGYVSDPGDMVMIENFTPTLPRDPAVTVIPTRLPKNRNAARTAMGFIDFDPNHGESEDAHWWLSEEDSVPFTPSLDAEIPIGTIIAGVLLPGPRAPQVADVRCTARWSAGRWTLLASRLLVTGRDDTLPIGKNTHIWVGVFDHTPANHTRHIRPIKLEVEE
jgi:hypothetical protein